MFYSAQKLPGREGSKVLYIIESERWEIKDNDYTGRISYTHSYNSSESLGSIVLTIDKVQLSDESEIICKVKDNTLAEQDEGHTQLKVFSKLKRVHLKKPDTLEAEESNTSSLLWSYSEQPNSKRLCSLDPPSIPEIHGTDKGISVDEDKLSMVKVKTFFWKSKFHEFGKIIVFLLRLRSAKWTMCTPDPTSLGIGAHSLSSPQKMVNAKTKPLHRTYNVILFLCDCVV